ALKKFQDEKVKWIEQVDADFADRYLAEDLVDAGSGEVLFEAGAEIGADVMKAVRKLKLKSFNILMIDHMNIGAYVRNSLNIDKTSSREEALIEIYRVMRPGEPPTVEAGEKLFNGLFFDLERYDLSNVGRMKMNARL